MSERCITGIADDGTLFPIGKLEAHRLGAAHVAISVFVFSQGRLLLQRRAAGKYHSAGQWANTCCSHPDWGESIEACAVRRLREEMGLQIPLHTAGVIAYRADVGGGLVENEQAHLFVGECDARHITLDPDPEEVADVDWVSPEALRRLVARTPQRFTPWLRLYLERAEETAIPQLAE